MPLITQGLLFSHIPKTAGTSLRKSIRKYSRRWKVYADYSEGNATTSGLINRLYESGDFSRIVEIDRHRSLLAGHFPIQKYLPYYPIHQVITIVRDPVQRALSHWYDLQRRIDYTDSLETFVEEDKFQNNQSRFLDGAPLEAIGLIGICEFYDDTIWLLNRIYGMKVPVRKLNTNRGKKSDFYMPTARIVELVRSCNAEDCEMYERAMRLFLTRRRLEQMNLPYVYGRIESLEENIIKGWASNPRSPEPVTLDVIINDKRVSTITADQPAPRLSHLNMSRNGEVAFSHALSQPLKPEDHLALRVPGTGQLIR